MFIRYVIFDQEQGLQRTHIDINQEKFTSLDRFIVWIHSK